MIAIKIKRCSTTNTDHNAITNSSVKPRFVVNEKVSFVIKNRTLRRKCCFHHFIFFLGIVHLKLRDKLRFVISLSWKDPEEDLQDLRVNPIMNAFPRGCFSSWSVGSLRPGDICNWTLKGPSKHPVISSRRVIDSYTNYISPRSCSAAAED